MSYVLATTGDVVRWYSFEVEAATQTFVLLDVLVMSKVPAFGDKASAQQAATALGLKTWRYVRI